MSALGFPATPISRPARTVPNRMVVELGFGGPSGSHHMVCTCRWALATRGRLPAPKRPSEPAGLGRCSRCTPPRTSRPGSAPRARPRPTGSSVHSRGSAITATASPATRPTPADPRSRPIERIARPGEGPTVDHDRCRPAGQECGPRLRERHQRPSVPHTPPRQRRAAIQTRPAGAKRRASRPQPGYEKPERQRPAHGDGRPHPKSEPRSHATVGEYRLVTASARQGGHLHWWRARQ